MGERTEGEVKIPGNTRVDLLGPTRGVEFSELNECRRYREIGTFHWHKWSKVLNPTSVNLSHCNKTDGVLHLLSSYKDDKRKFTGTTGINGSRLRWVRPG